MVAMIASGLIVGFAFGYVLQRGRFCLNCAFRDAIFAKDIALLQAYVLALVVQLVAVNFLAQLGLFRLTAPSFYWLAAVVGGFIFGLGMVLARGCASAIWYRSGEGKVAAIIAVFGFASGLGLTQVGFLKIFHKALRFSVIEVSGEVATLPNIFKISPWILIIIVIIFLGFGFLRSSSSSVRGGWTWMTTGLLLGAVGTVAWLASSSTGRFYGLSGTDTTGSLFNSLLRTDFSLADWGTFMILGTPLGAFVAARVTGEFKLRLPNFKQASQSFSGGLIMGFGAMTAAGCSIGHALTGVSILALSSITATVFIFLGVWLGSYLSLSYS